MLTGEIAGRVGGPWGIAAQDPRPLFSWRDQLFDYEDYFVAPRLRWRALSRPLWSPAFRNSCKLFQLRFGLQSRLGLWSQDFATGVKT